MTSTAARAGASGGFGVGGGTLVWTGAAFRLLDHDFTVLSRDGPVAGASIVDWPLGYREMAPYHDAVEEHIGVSGAVGPWEPSDRRPYPLSPARVSHALHGARGGLHASWPPAASGSRGDLVPGASGS